MEHRYISQSDIENMDRIKRMNLINAIPGYKSANLIGTVSKERETNLAIFSSVIHLGSNPALLGCIVRPDKIERHTLYNIRSIGEYTINHIHNNFVENAHYTSAKFEAGESEFKACGLTEEYLKDFTAPFVAESKIKIGLKLEEEVEIASNGTIMLVGRIEHILLPESILDKANQLDLNTAGSVAISGLNRYHQARQLAEFPYARKSELPEYLSKSKRKRKRPDNVVFNEVSQSYDAALKPYGTNLGAPAFSGAALSLWKNDSASKISKHFQQRFEEMQEKYQLMLDQIQWNEVVYNSKFNFEPVIGEVYHLYPGKEEQPFLSLIDPANWNRECLGSFRLNSERMWERLQTSN